MTKDHRAGYLEAQAGYYLRVHSLFLYGVQDKLLRSGRANRRIKQRRKILTNFKKSRRYSIC